MVDVAPAVSTDESGDLPRWDVSGFFPGIGSRELAVAHEGLVARLARLKAAFDEHQVRGGDPRPDGTPATAADVAALEAVLPALNDLLEELRSVSAYVYAHTSTDARDAAAATLQSRMQADTAGLATLSKRLEAWVAMVGADALVAASPLAADHAFPLRRAERAADHQMSEEQEDLAAELSLTGGRAWSKLHGELTSRLTVDVLFPGSHEPRTLPMAAVRGLATDPDAGVREAAFLAELAVWDDVAVPLANALNAFKGETNTLNRRRGWADSLDVALHNNNVDRETLAAMQEAVVASLPDFARANRARARLLGHQGALPWWDLVAPLGDGRRFAWAEATGAVASAFATYSPQLAGLVERAVTERWLDAEPRDGKVGGAFCMSVQGEVSRVLLNFDGSFDGVQTLAHELGHAYHNTQLGHRTPLQRQTPMALAETASIFCETVMVEAGLEAAGDDAGARLAILGTDLAGAGQVVVDIHSRFLFERAMTAERERGVLSVERLCELMTEAQHATYLDGLDHEQLHPYMWAVKGHYFTAYYNWPYTFGLLFGIGLFAEFRRDPERCRMGYDDLLASTGLGEADELAARFGIDVRSVDFWTASLDVLRARIDELCDLAGV